MEPSLRETSEDVHPPEWCPNCAKKDQQLEGLSLYISNLATKHQSVLQSIRDQEELMARLITDRNKALKERDDAEEKFDKATFAISS